MKNTLINRTILLLISFSCWGNASEVSNETDTGGGDGDGMRNGGPNARYFKLENSSFFDRNAGESQTYSSKEPPESKNEISAINDLVNEGLESGSSPIPETSSFSPSSSSSLVNCTEDKKSAVMVVTGVRSNYIANFDNENDGGSEPGDDVEIATWEAGALPDLQANAAHAVYTNAADGVDWQSKLMPAVAFHRHEEIDWHRQIMPEKTMEMRPPVAAALLPVRTPTTTKATSQDAYLRREANEISNFVDKIMAVLPMLPKSKVLKPIVVTTTTTGANLEESKKRFVNGKTTEEEGGNSTLDRGNVEKVAQDVKIEPQTIQSHPVITTTVEIQKSLPMQLKFIQEIDNQLLENAANQIPMLQIPQQVFPGQQILQQSHVLHPHMPQHLLIPREMLQQDHHPAIFQQQNNQQQVLQPQQPDNLQQILQQDHQQTIIQPQDNRQEIFQPHQILQQQQQQPIIQQEVPPSQRNNEQLVQQQMPQEPEQGIPAEQNFQLYVPQQEMRRKPLVTRQQENEAPQIHQPFFSPQQSLFIPQPMMLPPQQLLPPYNLPPFHRPLMHPDFVFYGGGGGVDGGGGGGGGGGKRQHTEEELLSLLFNQKREPTPSVGFARPQEVPTPGTFQIIPFSMIQPHRNVIPLRNHTDGKDDYGKLGRFPQGQKRYIPYVPFIPPFGKQYNNNQRYVPGFAFIRPHYYQQAKFHRKDEKEKLENFQRDKGDSKKYQSKEFAVDKDKHHSGKESEVEKIQQQQIQHQVHSHHHQQQQLLQQQQQHQIHQSQQQQPSKAPFKPSHPVWDSVYPPSHMYVVPVYMANKVPMEEPSSSNRRGKDRSRRHHTVMKRLMVEYGGFKPTMVPSTLLNTEDVGESKGSSHS